MWADNETRIDLLGFDFLVDELLVILRDPRLLPVTVGVELAGWHAPTRYLAGSPLTRTRVRRMIEHVFGSRLVLIGVVLLSLLLAALGAARPSSGAAPEARYVVRAGDSLWAIAETRYSGDLREAVWRIQERNGLQSPAISPGDILVLP